MNDGLIQNGQVFNYEEQPQQSFADLLQETFDQKIDQETGEILPAPSKVKKVKAGKTFIEVPVQAEPAPQTNFQVAARPSVDIPQLIEWILAHPGTTHAEISSAYGRPAGWFSTVLVMEEFQAAIGPHRAAILNPDITSTIQERFQALLIRSAGILQTKLSVANPNDLLVLETAKLGVRALGLGMAGQQGPAVSAPQSLESIADRLTNLITSRKKGSAIGHVPAATEVILDVKVKEL